jgi:dephospho-CoA kinase
MAAARPRRAPANDGLWIVGIVGQAGSGKSTVARALERDGAIVVDADQLGHEVVDGDPEVRAALVAEYGPAVYGPTGLDRPVVAARVFREPSARERLNRLVHPRIIGRMRARIDAARTRGYRGIVAIDAALLLDWGLERELDQVVAVVATRDAQLERLATQRGWSREEAERRIAAQRPATELAAAADVVLDNHGDVAALEAAARAAVRPRA